MQTTFGRWLYFGPFIVNPDFRANQVVLRYGSEATHRPTGLFFDALKESISLPLDEVGNSSMGVIQSPRPADAIRPRHTEPRLYYPHTLPRIDGLLACDPHRMFVSKVALQGALEIKLQRAGNRVRSLLVSLGDGVMQVLGAWDPSRPRDASPTIFTADQDPKLSSITFVMSHLHYRTERETFVKDVIINGDETDEPCFRWERLYEVCLDPARVTETLRIVMNLLTDASLRKLPGSSPMIKIMSDILRAMNSGLIAGFLRVNGSRSTSRAYA